MVAIASLLPACERELRLFRTPPPAAASSDDARRLATQPMATVPGAAGAQRPFEHNAFAVAQGKRWFRWYNCNGCHAAGGGGMGPALIDAHWIYGSRPQDVFETISSGRPNGMPAFGGRIPDDHIWQLVAYVRSMSAQLRADVLPGRSDHLHALQPELRRDERQPRRHAVPPGRTP
ncbi:MAG TPA: c-type cytochrome [Burkholderiaceae bacterium]|nr:c-type cytochrome [Burkholderiaceae bacterium]